MLLSYELFMLSFVTRIFLVTSEKEKKWNSVISYKQVPANK
jgi:hypothetical protein